MIGERVVIVADFSSGRGRVRYGDTEWAAETTDSSDPKAGETWTVSAVKGVVLEISSHAK
jgi:membrane protein implicated in regulation of membrane protease activity